MDQHLPGFRCFSSRRANTTRRIHDRIGHAHDAIITHPSKNGTGFQYAFARTKDDAFPTHEAYPLSEWGGMANHDDPRFSGGKLGNGVGGCQSRQRMLS